MKAKSRTLHSQIWVFLLLFSTFILIFLWLIQILFFNTYYESHKSKELKEATLELQSHYGEENFQEFLDRLSYDEGICIDIEKNGYISYRTFSFNRGCMVKGDSQYYRQDFKKSGEELKAYKLDNPKFENEILIYAVQLDSNTYAYVSTSIEPLDSATRLLRKQFLIISIFILCLSILIAYFLSKMISRPMERISRQASDIANGNFQETFHSNSEIKEIRMLENSLEEMKEEFQKTEELRRDLMANVSHDLKTPLTMIKAYAEMVRDLTYKDKKKRTENLNVIIEESERLNALVDDILTLSSMQAEMIPLEYHEFSLDELMNSIVEHFHVLLKEENYQILYEPVPCHVLADKKRTEQVIYNIINNAINYTGEDKKVMIRVQEQKDTVRVEIQDTGVGIPEEERKNVWNKYYHSAKKHKRNRIGTGLGLSIVKNILEKNGLPYGIESGKPTGTIFYFELRKANPTENK